MTREKRKEAVEEVAKKMECQGEAMEEERNNEGTMESDRDKENTRSLSINEISVRGTERKKTRQENLGKYKMVRTRRGLIYEVDLTEEEKGQLGKQEEKYKHTHVGVKIIEASLILSVRVSNNETNKAIILRYCMNKVTGFHKSLIAGLAGWHFESYQETNKCLKDKGLVEGEVYIKFSIPDRLKRCKGIITAWDMRPMFDRAESLVINNNIVETERL